MDPDDAPPRLPSRNPLPLSSAQEMQVRELYHQRVRAKCADEIRAFAACAMNRTFTTTWVCREQHRAMNSCMIGYATQAEEDAAREQYFAGADDRRAARAAKQAHKKQAEKFFREWWDLDEKERLAAEDVELRKARHLEPESHG